MHKRKAGPKSAEALKQPTSFSGSRAGAWAQAKIPQISERTRLRLEQMMPVASVVLGLEVLVLEAVVAWESRRGSGGSGAWSY